jgi:geranylgeranyl pyrophosphate synthase
MSTATLDVTHAPDGVQRFLQRASAAVDQELQRRLAIVGDDPGKLQQAMAYAVLGGGKRLRPAVALAVAQALRPDATDKFSARRLCVAAAVEMLHAYTLVHDDLPAMDDDDERRGRPTVHIAFGEAIAILAGDGLLNLALMTLAELGIDAGRALHVLAERAGHLQLLAGQAIDLSMDKQVMSFAQLTDLHAKKTGALFAAAAELGAISVGAATEISRDMGEYGMAIGIAFQHADDRDDHEFAHFDTEARQAMKRECMRAVALVRHHAASDTVVEQIAEWIGSKS